MDGVMGFTTLFAGSFAPNNWAFCNGQLLPIAQYTALFSILGVTYGGDGKSTFALPNLQGRAVVGAGASGEGFYTLGESDGSEMSFLSTANQMPSHVHAVKVSITPGANGTANAASPANAVYATSASALYNYSADTLLQGSPGFVTMQLTGTSQPFPTLHPVLPINYVICLAGVFPQKG